MEFTKNFAGFAIAVTLATAAFGADPPAEKIAIDISQRGVHVYLGADNKAVPHVFRSDTLIGMTVRDSKNNDLGAVNDLVLDFESGHVRYAAISFGGFLGFGEKLFAVPLGAMSLNYDPEKETSYLVFDVTKEKLESSPGFDKDHWPDVADPQWAKEIDTFYGVTAGKTTIGVDVDESEKTPRQERKAAREERRENRRIRREAAATEGHHILRASKLIDLTVMNDKDKTLGQVGDLVINAESATLTHLIVSVGAVAGVGGERIAVPLELATLKQSVSDNKEYVVLPIDAQRFKDAPRIGETWPDFNEPKWSQKFDRYFIVDTAAK